MEDCLFGSQLGFFNLIHCILVAVVLPKCVLLLISARRLRRVSFDVLPLAFERELN